MIGLALSASQAAYDAALDLTGVRVGTFRAVVLIATQIGIRVAQGFLTNQIEYAVLSVPFIGLLWLISFAARSRCRIDDLDQNAGRLDAVNARARKDREIIVGVTTILVFVVAVGLCLLDLDERTYALASGISFWLFFIHECLFVRERNEARFKIASPARTAGGAA